ncbi:hypothetical protein SAMN04487913_115119 [Arthrobacter sp. ok362]|nr:hypothetical protein SAMN04487913_115119 [Arthrobacter sp. ok362]
MDTQELCADEPDERLTWMAAEFPGYSHGLCAVPGLAANPVSSLCDIGSGLVCGRRLERVWPGRRVAVVLFPD